MEPSVAGSEGLSESEQMSQREAERLDYLPGIQCHVGPGDGSMSSGVPVSSLPDLEDPAEEDFYDCQETIELSDKTGRTEGGMGDSDTKREKDADRSRVLEGENHQAAGGHQTRAHMDTQSEQPDAGQTGSTRQGTDTPADDPGAVGGGAAEAAALWDECTEDGGGTDSDTELKEEENKAPEFDDDYLREVEKNLTEEERESRRQESLVLKEKGNTQFKAGEHTEAESSYTEALGVCPVCFSKERAVLFSNRAAARIHLDMKDKAIADCSRAIELNPEYVRAILRRAELYEKTDKLDEALEDYKTVLEKDPGQHTAREACMRLPQQIHERNEKMKEEMMSKLKDLGNMFLRPFGLSTNNFQVNQDSNTGSYSVNFVQKDNNNR